jgi:trehalose 2-sulfotransferase
MHPRSSYLILATPRSGSYLLCEALINTQVAGRPTEYFGTPQIRALLKQGGLANFAACLARILQEGSTPNGVFGAKIIWEFREYFIDRLREIDGYEKLPMPQLLSTVFPNLRYIWITRRDKVRQAISYWKALQTGSWVEVQDWETKYAVHLPAGWQELAAKGQRENRRMWGIVDGEVKFDFKAIERLRQGIEDDETEIQQYFALCGVSPFTVVYEDLVQHYEETARQILAYLRIPEPENLVFGARKLQKQSNEQSEEWLQKYYRLKTGMYI